MQAKPLNGGWAVAAPWGGGPILCLAIAAFAAVFAAVAISRRMWDGVALAGLGLAVSLLGLRVMRTNRLRISPEGIEYPRDPLSGRTEIISWRNVESVEFALVSGFAAPTLIFTMRGGEKPVRMPFPLVSAEERNEALGLIEQYLSESRENR